MHDARNSYTQYVPFRYRLLGRYLDKAYNSVSGGVGSNPPHGISNKPSPCSKRALHEGSGLLCKLLKFCSKCEKITGCCVDVDAQVVPRLGRLPETLGGVEE
jgi:hypothetical protein